MMDIDSLSEIERPENGHKEKVIRKRKPWVYRSEYEALESKCKRYRSAFFFALGVDIGWLLIKIFS